MPTIPTVSSRSSHDGDDRDVASLYTGYLRCRIDLGALKVFFEVGHQLIWDIGRFGAEHVMAPFFECEITSLSGDGCYYVRGEHGVREIEVWRGLGWGNEDENLRDNFKMKF